jgi:hypothetical protein
VADHYVSITTNHERDNIFRLDVSGVLTRADFEKSEVVLAGEIPHLGQLRLLFVLKDFEGWEADTNWNDLTFYVKHGENVERIAIVGDARWESESMMFAAAGLRRAPVKFFVNDLASARHWLSA